MRRVVAVHDCRPDPISQDQFREHVVSLIDSHFWSTVNSDRAGLACFFNYVMCRNADSVVIVPGYGMAVAHSQQPVSKLTNRLKDAGINIRFAIHPLAGHMPGYMNVLLAESNVPYDLVQKMDEINEGLCHTDVVIVIGANDIVNPSALENPNSPIAAMTVLEAWKARHVIVSKRSMATGYADVENPLYFRENTRMLFGDDKDCVNGILSNL